MNDDREPIGNGAGGRIIHIEDTQPQGAQGAMTRG